MFYPLLFNYYKILVLNCLKFDTAVIMKSLMKKKQKGAILELKRRHLKKVSNYNNMLYPTRKIRRICTSSSQERVLINSLSGVSLATLYAVLTAVTSGFSDTINTGLKYEVQCAKTYSLHIILLNTNFQGQEEQPRMLYADALIVTGLFVSSNYEVTCKEEAKRRNSRTKMKTFEESNKTSTIRRIQQGRYFVSAPARHKNAFLSIPYPALQGKLTLYAVSTYLDTAYPWIFRQYKYWTQIRSLVCKNILSTYYTFEDEFLRPRRAAKVNMDDPNIIMEEYIRLEEEKAHKRGKVYNWETANNYEVTCEEEAKRRNSGTKTKTFEESTKIETIHRIQQGRYGVSAPAHHKNAFLSIPYLAYPLLLYTPY
ncbi:hypothetical protein Tco_0830421 [Tanacetum coccineum]